ncbi:MAG: ABC transporter permease [Bdellovibrionota bacterium]|nr:ABC transporter permease [Pseudobdellovibrionaceae bacterium]|tara:strand:+ start:1119 stop:1907 length:789 start_codon:yes stop_codon:yes gene_type:complete
MASARKSGFPMLYYREYRRIVRVIKQTVFTPLINTGLYLMIFGVSLGESITMDTGFSYLVFLIPGLVMMGALNNSFQNTSSSVTNSKFHGELQDLRVMPLSYSSIVWALCLGGLTRGLMVGGLIGMMGFVFNYFYYGDLLGVAHPFLLFAFLIIGSLIFAQIGIAVAFWASSFEQLSAVGNFILLPLMYLGGVFYSIDGLSPVWQNISKLNPLFYLINGVRFGMLGKSDVEPYFALSVSLVSFVVLFFVARNCVKNGKYQRF